ncbi:MAG TPA: 16S rRNA (cytosine(967)-C(5))-methyltransferase RsmB [Acidisarcina sp.]|nr:16S rRNA (cytosine(967)-C(5))-methyltransferase RsmB [Acidisarcina sp.]
MAVTISPARAAASNILLKIAHNQGHCDELLRSRQVELLTPVDRNLCTNLVMGTLRWQMALDSQVDAFLTRPGNRLSEEIRIALRLGAFQLLHLDRIPAHAAISESVELAKSAENKFAAGMVNAVLRKIAAGGARSRHDSTTPVGIASATAHPAWLVERWAANYGLEAAAAICAFDQDQPPLHIRIVSDGVEEALQQEGIELAPSSYLTRARRVARGDVTATVAYRKGLVRIQDEGSQLVAELAGEGAAILDCCAAPGGKTTILAEKNPSSSIVACDVSARRLEQMKGLLRALPESTHVRFQAADAATLPFKDEFDLVLCDVPCSGTGTIARNPEIRHRLKPEDILRHRERQIAILQSVMSAVKPGGRVLYSTCSLEPEENEQVVAECLQSSAGYRLLPLQDRLTGLVETGACHAEGAATLQETGFRNGFLRTLPGVHACDGFFAAMLIRD